MCVCKCLWNQNVCVMCVWIRVVQSECLCNGCVYTIGFCLDKSTFTNMQTTFWIVATFIVNHFLPVIRSEYFSSSSHLKDLLQVEIKLLKHLKEYIKTEEDRIAKLHKFYSRSEHMSTNWTKEYNELKSYINNPVDIYRNMKRKRSDLMKLKVLSRKKKGLYYLRHHYLLSHQS